jgi:transcriptional regulator with XRE-family HTH domain
MTLRDLAKKSGLSLPYVAGLERGTSEAPPRRTCNAFARVFNVQPDEIWRRAFSDRLEKWLKRQGFAHITGRALSDIAERIEEAEKRSS